MNDKTYSSKANAVRGAKRQGLTPDDYTVEQGRGGRYFLALVQTEDAAERKWREINAIGGKWDTRALTREDNYIHGKNSYPFSAVHRPVAWVWSYLQSRYGDVPLDAVRRKDAISGMIENGVNLNTARTQFQRWRKARLEGDNGDGGDE